MFGCALKIQVRRWFLVLALVAWTGGCATRNISQANHRPFVFGQDTFSYRNDLVWEYVFDDASGRTSHRPRDPKSDYTHHCFVMVRSARQFFQFALFDPAQPSVDDKTYRRLIGQVVARDPMRSIRQEKRIIIPGYASLSELSVAKPGLLQEECGGAWRSYFQRAHWRMIWSFSRSGQAEEADWLAREIENRRPPVVHLVRFPQLTINHAVLLFGVRETPGEVEFSAYDPFEPNQPVPLVFNKGTRTFHFPRNPYYIGGEVNVYEIYRSWAY